MVPREQLVGTPLAPAPGSRASCRRPCSIRHVAARATAEPTGRVYRATCPLVGWEQVAAAMGPLYPPQLALHHFVVLEAADGGGVTAFDFLPADPTSPATAASLFSGGSVQGAMLCLWAAGTAFIWGRFPATFSPTCGRPGRSQAVRWPHEQCRCRNRTHSRRQHALHPSKRAGMTRTRPLSGVPRQRCQYCGTTRVSDPLAAAAAFQQQYDCRLQLLRNDCSHHADGLIRLLLHDGGSGGGSSGGTTSSSSGSSSSRNGKPASGKTPAVQAP